MEWIVGGFAGFLVLGVAWAIRDWWTGSRIVEDDGALDPTTEAERSVRIYHKRRF